MKVRTVRAATPEGTVHRVNERTTPRERAEAVADLREFFDDIVDKHHGGW